ncbi:MAG TPA: alpha-xylosidase, partial [Phototrophicaceae bacterium]|nr:alpha-xylosidase [Phototrophicaceae bacterium]
MKFDNGYWQLLPGTQAIHPLTIVDVQVEPDALTITGYDHVIHNRASYISGTSITARFTSPMPNVIRVQLTHFKGRQPRLPAFDLDYARTNPDVAVGRDDKQAWLQAGNLKIVAPTQGKWGFQFWRDGQLLTASEDRAVGLFQQNGTTYLREQLAVQAGEAIYGLGEHFGPLVKNGQSVDIWNADGGTSTDLAYKNVPFYLTSRGYGVLVNHPGKVSFEITSHWVGRTQFSVEGHSLDYYLFGGPTPKDVLEQYTALSGRPALLPDWSFGLWLSTSFQTDYDEPTILKNIERMEALGIPISVFHFDCYWMKELTWCSFLWDDRFFPDPARLLRRIKEKGVKVCLWINPYIAEASPLFAEGMEHGYLLQTPEGDVFQIDDWQPGIGFVDFTNPDARAWYAGKLRALVDIGVDAFKTDFGERIPTAVKYFNGADPERMHNYYTYLYNPPSTHAAA